MQTRSIFLLLLLLLVGLAQAPPAKAQADASCDKDSVIPGYYLYHAAKVTDAIPAQFGIDEDQIYMQKKANMRLRDGQRMLLAGNAEGTADLLVDDELKVSTGKSVWKHDFRAEDGSETHVPIPPQEITDIMQGYNLVFVYLYNRSGPRVASSPIYMLVFNACKSQPTAEPTATPLPTATPMPTQTATAPATAAPTIAPTATKVSATQTTALPTPDAVIATPVPPNSMAERQNRVPVRLLLFAALFIGWQIYRARRANNR